MAEIKQQILRILLDEPGHSRETLRAAFRLNDYRLSKILRHIDQELPDKTVISDRERGVWIVAVEDGRCSGMVWMGRKEGGFRQCDQNACFADGRCYDHSECRNPEMVAFVQYVRYLAGPARPTAYTFLQLGIVQVEELLQKITTIVPATRREGIERELYVRMLRAAYATLHWRLRIRRASQEQGIPFEFWERHRRSSMNPFEFSLKKYFELLEIPVNSTRKEVLKAWKKLCRRYHPDMEDGDEERMKKINLAKERIFRIRRWT